MKRSLETLYKDLCRNALERGIRVTLTLTMFIAVRRNAVCHYCGGALPDKGSGLDRINNDGGYALSNVVPCCSMCNKVRGAWLTYEEFRAAMAVRVAQTGRGNAWPNHAERQQRKDAREVSSWRLKRLKSQQSEAAKCVS